AVELGHLVIDDEAVDRRMIRCVEQRDAAAERADVKPVGLEQEAERAEDVGIVIGDVDLGFGVNRHGTCRENVMLNRDTTLQSIPSRPLDLAQSFKAPARIASRTSSERLFAPILVI